MGLAYIFQQPTNMNELIWFSIPGAVLLYAARILFPSLRASPDALVIAAAPVIGFLFHQLYRTLFELCGGWESPRRAVLSAIRSAYAISDTDRHTIFLIWETTIYSDGIPDGFRDHDRGTWHYIMSFRSISLSAALAGICLASAILDQRIVSHGSCSGLRFCQLGVLPKVTLDTCIDWAPRDRLFPASPSFLRYHSQSSRRRGTQTKAPTLTSNRCPNPHHNKPPPPNPSVRC